MSAARSERIARPVLRYTVRRLVSLVPVLLGVTLLTYGLMYLSPQDPVDALLQGQGTASTPEVTEAMRHQLGLDRPFLLQYLDWLRRFLCGDMGTSYANGEPVAQKLLSALPNTLKLTISSVVLTMLLSVPLGVLTAVRQGKPVDLIIRFFCFLGNSLPNFIVSLLLLYFLALKLGCFPVLSTGGWDSLVLPTLALAMPMTGKYIRQVRAAVLEQLGKPYVAGARARGLSSRLILFSYVLRNAMGSILTLMSLSVGSLLGGTAAVEVIFSLPGMGYMLMRAVTARDYPVIQAFVVFMSLIYLLINLFTDLFCCCADPRVCTGMEVMS